MKNKSLEIVIILVVLLFTLASLTYLSYLEGIREGNKQGKEIGINDGLAKAESNCVDFVCGKNPEVCKDINNILQIQTGCKSYVYGTDFYVKTG